MTEQRNTKRDTKSAGIDVIKGTTRLYCAQSFIFPNEIDIVRFQFKLTTPNKTRPVLVVFRSMSDVWSVQKKTLLHALVCIFHMYVILKLFA